jgi:hypothetical protein
MAIVYLAKFSNGASYVGVTKQTLEARMKGYVAELNSKRYPHRMLNKNLQEAGLPVLTPLEECADEVRFTRERFWIQQCDSALNMSKGRIDEVPGALPPKKCKPVVIPVAPPPVPVVEEDPAWEEAKRRSTKYWAMRRAGGVLGW